MNCNLASEKLLNISYFSLFYSLNKKVTWQWNSTCRTFADLAFDTVDHNIIIQKMNYYGIRGAVDIWLSSYLQNKLQFVSINDFNCNFKQVYYAVGQSIILGQLLFSFLLIVFNCAIRHCLVHNFKDD